MATVSSQTRSTTITLASATAGPFDVGIRIFSDNLRVTVNDVISTDYTISSTYSDGYSDDATITFGEAQAIGDVIIIDSLQPFGRDADYSATEPGLAAKLNIELGRVAALVGDLFRDVARSNDAADGLAAAEANAAQSATDASNSAAAAASSASAASAFSGRVLMGWAQVNGDGTTSDLGGTITSVSRVNQGNYLVVESGLPANARDTKLVMVQGSSSNVAGSNALARTLSDTNTQVVIQNLSGTQVDGAFDIMIFNDPSVLD